MAAKSDTETPKASEPVTAQAASQVPPRKFQVKAPKPFTGKRRGLDFKDGLAETTNAITAHSALEIGCTVSDAATGKAAFDCDKPDALAKLAERAKANW